MHSKTFVMMTTSLGLKCGPVRKGVTPKRVLEHVLQEMARIKADNCLSNDPEAIELFKGKWEAYRNVAHFIAPLTDLKNGNGNGGGPNAVGMIGQIVNAASR